MGMAASQARYVQLTARKANCEYEGQQINQARTNLANEVAGLFNDMLRLELPEVPSTSDYTTEQYSYTDGNNEYVIDSWKQTSSYDGDRNYVVTSHYIRDIYQGAQKKLRDPQVQADKNYSDYVNTVSSATKNADNSYTLIDQNNITLNYSSVSNINDAILAEQLEKFKTAIGNPALSNDSIVGYQEGSTWHFALNAELDNIVDGNANTYSDYAETAFPTYIGNNRLNELTSLTEAQITELTQIVQDIPDNNISNYFTLNADGSYNYTGSGLYSFSMNGLNYFTSYDDLMLSYNNPQLTTSPIDNQQELLYYNASYIPTKVSMTGNAVIETDESGRFASVRFDNDSNIYSLNFETVTDDVAYQNAMNEYEHAVQVYHKTIEDINAKTSTIQKEDQQLELKLAQLDTEQKAIAAEMESVKKVIGDSIEKIFKTFQS